MSVFRPAFAIAMKDLRIEWRSRTALLTATCFAVLVLLIVVFARDTGSVSLTMTAPGVLWIALALASMVALNRGFLIEREHSAFDAILLAPVPRVSIFIGKWLANLGFVLGIVTIAFPLWILFFAVPMSSRLGVVLGLVLLAAIGFTAIGTLFSAMTSRTRYAELLLPVLMLPFLIPPIFFAAQATVRVLAGRPMGELWGWFRFLALYDVLFVLLVAMLFPIVVDE